MDLKKKQTDVRKIVFKITQELSADDIQSANFFLQDNSFKKCENVHELRETLEKLAYFNVSKAEVKGLIDLLGVIGRKDLQNQLEEEDEKILSQYRKNLERRKSDETEPKSPDRSFRPTNFDGNNVKDLSGCGRRKSDETECKSLDSSFNEPTNLEGAENTSDMEASRFQSDIEVDISGLPLDDDLRKSERSRPYSAQQETPIKQEDNSSVKDMPPPPPEITLRGYQLELGLKAKKGINNIICSPTGSGKTITAASVIKHHLDEARRCDYDYRVLYLVHIRNLVIHLSADLTRVLKDDVYALKEDDFLNSEVVQKKAVVILTAQILLNALKDIVTLSSYDLLVFDECHNTVGNHPYKKIMMEYHELKRNQKKAPQILGLSATLAGGTDPFKSIVNLCTNMHILSVSSVCDEKNREELLEKNQAPLIDKIIPCKNRPVNTDNFYRTISILIDEFIMELKHCKIKLNSFKYGQLEFESILSQMKNVSDINNWRDDSKILEFLLTLNKTLMYYNDLTAFDAVTYLHEKLDKTDNSDLEIGEKIIKHYNANQGGLHTFAVHDKLENNDKLLKLKQLLKDYLEPNPEKKVIIFCKEKFITVNLKELLANDKELKKFVKVDHLVGQSGDTGLSQPQQRNVLKRFEGDELNVLVTTSIAEQGLNIPACEIVIRYTYVTSDISRRQAQGRARAENSKCFLIVDENNDIISRECRNKEKEKEMDKAVIKVVEMGEENFKEFILEQIAQLHADLNKQRPKLQYPYDANKVTIFCKECHAELCLGSDIIKKGSDYICIDSAFQDKVKQVPMKEQVFRMDSNIAISFCNGPKCKNKFGAIKKYNNGERRNGFVLNVRNILFQYAGDAQKILLKQWSKHPFEIEEESLT